MGFIREISKKTENCIIISWIKEPVCRADNNLASVTVIAENGAMADAYATALSVMGEEKAIAFQKKHPQIQIILIRKDGTFYQSEKAGMIKS